MGKVYNGQEYVTELICDIYCLGTGGQITTTIDSWGDEYEECEWSNVGYTELWPNGVCGDYVY